jgi:hypothetical protein
VPKLIGAKEEGCKYESIYEWIESVFKIVDVKLPLFMESTDK